MKQSWNSGVNQPVNFNGSSTDQWRAYSSQPFIHAREKSKLLQAVSFCAASLIKRTAVTLLQRIRGLSVK